MVVRERVATGGRGRRGIFANYDEKIMFAGCMFNILRGKLAG